MLTIRLTVNSCFNRGEAVIHIPAENTHGGDDDCSDEGCHDSVFDSGSAPFIFE